MSFYDFLDFFHYFLAFLLCFRFVSSETETDWSDRLFLSFKFIESFLVLFLNFRVANDIKKYLDYEVMIGVLYFGLSLGHFGDIDEFYILNINCLDDGIEFKKFLNRIVF